MFHMSIVVIVSQVHTYGKTSKIVYFKHVQLIIRQLYFTKAGKIMQADRKSRWKVSWELEDNSKKEDAKKRVSI